jgi:two-component sensor histidine kinase
LTASIIEALRKTVDELAERTQQLAEAREQLAADNAQLATAREQLSLDNEALASADERQKLLLADINHRIKNNLQSVTGLLSLAAHRVETPEDAKSTLKAAASRLTVLGRVYDRLHLSDDAVSLDAHSFIAALCSDLKQSLGELRPITLRVEADAAVLDSNRAAIVGLIINELVTNSLKYAYPDGSEGEIVVRFNRCAEGLELSVCDDGVGIGDVRQGASGTRLVKALARQLGGQATWISPPGTRVDILFPEQQSGRQVF